MSVIEDLMKEVTTVKDANDKLKSQVNEGETHIISSLVSVSGVFIN